MPENPETPETPVATYERLTPYSARLWVKVSNGEEWEATPADIQRFSLLSREEAYSFITGNLAEILAFHDLLKDDTDRAVLTDADLEPLRHLIEVTLLHPDNLGDPEHDDWASVAALEQRLRDNPAT